MAPAPEHWNHGSVDVNGATIRYREAGEGPPVVFVHGIYVGGSVWIPTAERLTGVRVIVPTWPLGGHRDPMSGVDLSARAIAQMIPDFLAALDLRDVTLVGNDTGGGLCLAALASESSGLSRIGRLVLTNCDSYEHFPPQGFDKIAELARKRPRLVRWMLWMFTTSFGRRYFLKSVCATPPQGQDAVKIFESFTDSKRSRLDSLATTATLEPAVTLDAVSELKSFDRPVLLIWGDADELFPLEHATRLHADFPHAQLEVVHGAKTYVMIDAPEQTAALISAFAQEAG